jgi:hypothetical protein
MRLGLLRLLAMGTKDCCPPGGMGLRDRDLFFKF